MHLLTRPQALTVGASLTLTIALAACAASSGGSAATQTPATASPDDPAATSPAASPIASATPVGKVSANAASEAEIATALAAAGVPHAARWAREVTEYRPYPTDDPTLQKLQQNLAKYNPDPATLAGILSALAP